MDDSINLAFWIGLAIAIPLSIVGNLLTPLFQKKWESRSERSRAARQEERRKELNILERFAKHRDEYNEFQFSIIVRTTIINALAGGLSALFNSFGSAWFVLPFFKSSIPDERLANIFFVMANLLVALAALITMNIARQAWHYHRALRNLDLYAQENGLERQLPPAA